MRAPKAEGVSLIEVLLAVAVILIISAIAIPKLKSAKNQSGQASAAASVPDIVGAQEIYTSLNPAAGYAGQMGKFGGSETIDPELGCSLQPYFKNSCEFYSATGELPASAEVCYRIQSNRR